MKKMLIALLAVLTIGANLVAGCGGCSRTNSCGPDGGRGQGYSRGAGQPQCAWKFQDCCNNDCGCNC